MKRLLSIPGIVLLLVGSVFGQSQQTQMTMTLTGAVYDWNGAVIVVTKVSARDRDGKSFEAATNDEGIYKLQLPLGVYDLEATAHGFCTRSVKGFRVVNATHGRMSLDFVLEVASSHGPCSRAIKDQTKPHERKQKNQQAAERLLKQ